MGENISPLFGRYPTENNYSSDRAFKALNAIYEYQKTTTPGTTIKARPPPPGKPHLVSETESTPDLVSIQWTKPVADGGSPISGYLVEHRRTGSPHWVRATPLLVQGSELTISGLEPGWRYQFRVSAQNAVGISDPSELSEPITVTLQRSAITAPRFTQDLEELTALENEKAEFVVHFLGQPAPKICWYKDAYEIFSSRRIRILTEPDKSILTIHQCSLSDEGEIKCTATNRAGHVTSKAKLTVEALPSIRLPRQYEDGLLFEIGELIRLKVSVAGRPNPLVFWTHNGESIKNNDRYEIEYIDNSSILKINEARREDRGEYQIKAVNKLGENTQSFLVTVTDKPSPPGKARVVMTLGRSVTLSWSKPDDDGGCKIGNYIVEYYRLGWNVWLKAATSRQLTTMLGDLIEGSEYKFRIKAESPYGVSEPSDETEVVFIPDPKRGILQAPNRSRSQPREVKQDPTTPVAARRKNKPRSVSTTRVEGNQQYPLKENIVPIEAPKRPERIKVKSPPITPKVSPMAVRKNVDTEVNKKIFEQSDRSSMARELAYGSPDLKMKKEPNISTEKRVNGSEQSRTPSPAMKQDFQRKLSIKIERSPEREKSRSMSPEVIKRKLGKGGNDNVTGSSEFMLVLYPGENERGQNDFDFDDDIPPPMSLSAPELGSEGPLFSPMRYSASSTELLHERAMMRLYEAAEAEEELKSHQSIDSRKASVDIPKIQINSKDAADIVGLERRNSGRRMSAGGLNQKQIKWAQRRLSLKNPVELEDEKLNKLRKFPENLEDKRNLQMNKQRSESEEREEEVFEEARKRSQKRNHQESNNTTRTNKINIAELERWADDYESSTASETESSSSEDERKEVINRYKPRYSDGEEEQDTYHPRGMTSPTVTSDKDPFEILTVRKDPPSPDFIPKPILKRIEHEEEVLKPVPPPRSPPKSPQFPARQRPLSPAPMPSPQRDRSLSLTTDTLVQPPRDIKAAFEQNSPPKARKQRSFSLLPQRDLLSKKIDKIDSAPKSPPPQGSSPFSMLSSIAEVAKISGITAASIVIPDTLLEKQKDADEAKVVIDHYGDIVRNYGGRRRSNPQVHTDRDALRKAAEGINSSPTRNTASLESNIGDAKENLFTTSSLMMDHYGTPNRLNVLTNSNQTVKTENQQLQSDFVKKDITKSNGGPSIQDNYLHKNLSPTRSRMMPSNQYIQPVVADFEQNTLSHQYSIDPNGTGNIISKNDLPLARTSSLTMDRSYQYDSSYSPIANVETNLKSNSLPSRKTNPSPLRKSAPSPSRKTNPSPLRKTDSSPLRKTEPSPLRKKESPSLTNTELPSSQKTGPSPVRQSSRKTSPSPLRASTQKIVPPPPLRKEDPPTPINSVTRSYRPMLREIMTQTSEDPYIYDSDFSNFSRTSTPPFRNYHQEELMVKAEIKVRSFMDYLTDLAMFAVACWFYFFSNELYAVPVLLVMVYRQLQEEIRKRIPEWIKRRFARKQKQ